MTTRTAEGSIPRGLFAGDRDVHALGVCGRALPGPARVAAGSAGAAPTPASAEDDARHDGPADAGRAALVTAGRGGGRAAADQWAAGREVLRAADPRMASLVEADPGLDPDALLDGLPRDLWGALVLQVIGQQLSLAAAAAILARLEALHGGRLPRPAELLATDAETLRGIGLSRAKAVYLHDLAARLEDGRLNPERLRTLEDDAARTELTQVKGVGRFTADGVLMLALRRPDVWPAADLALRRAVERVWELDAPASVAQVDAIGERFRPWRTLAAVYLYRTRTA
jgi:DNA-3-methyladenine glycosylase II